VAPVALVSVPSEDEEALRLLTTLAVTLLVLAAQALAAVPTWPWLALAHCEQGTGPRLQQVNWKAYSLSYEGGYGFTHDAWDRFRYPKMPTAANQATPEQQTRVAQRIQRAVGWGAWPSCSIRLGLR
jgi:hypothetical protein